MALKKVFIFWCSPEGGSGRGQRLCDALEAQAVHSYIERILGIPLPTPLRYAAQTVHTLYHLLRIRPQQVFVQVPPVFAPLMVALYCKLWGARYANDMHTSFIDPRWQRFHWLHRPLCRNATVNLAHNEANQELLQDWRARNVMLLKSPAVTRKEIFDDSADITPWEKALQARKRNVLMVNRFAVDDAYLQVIDTAKRMPDTTFFLTGNPKKLQEPLPELPDNVILTDLLPRPVFLKLMDACDVVLTLTLRDDTLLWSIRECLALGKPFVASHWRVVQLEFDGYGLFTNHDPEDLAAKIRDAHQRTSEFVAKMAQYIEQDKLRWKNCIEQVKTYMDAPPSAPTTPRA